MPKVAPHLHKYKRINLGRNGKEYWVYRCMKPACTHYIPVHLSEGKLCECNRCHEPMVITKQVLQGSDNRALARPHCEDCTKRKGNNEQILNQETVASIEAFLQANTGGTKPTE